MLPPPAHIAKCRVAANAPQSGVNNIASGKTGRAAATRGMRFPHTPRSA